MATLKEVNLKIAAVKKTKQITKAMNMVAASKLRGAQLKMEGFRPYATKFAEVLGNLAESAGDESNPLLIPREEVAKVHIVLCTSDRGLCGGFNANLISQAQKLAAEKKDQGCEVTFTAFGKRGRNWLKREKFAITDEYLGIVGTNFEFHIAATAGQKLVDGFLEEVYDEVYIIFSEFISTAKQAPASRQVLPIPSIAKEETAQEESGPYLAEHICEPSPEALLGELLPKSVDVQLFSALLETSTSNHAAQMMAMDNATKACNDMIQNLTLAYNKARQAAITAELMDIVGGAEALKG